VPRAVKPFFIPVVHSLPGAVGHMTALELPSQEGRAKSHGTCGSTRAHLVKDARSRAEGHMIASELTSARRRGPVPRDMWQHPELTSARRRCSELRDTWWHWSSPQQGGEVRGRGTHGGSRAHLCREVWSEATAYVAAHECTPYSLS
jgi:hypothetical protein